MSHRYSTALSHIFLAGTGMCCLYAYKGAAQGFARATFGIITVNSLLGIWRWGNPEHGETVDKPYRFTSFIQTILALPCFSCHMWLVYGYSWETYQIGYLWPILSVFPLVQYFADDRINEGLVELVLAADAIALGMCAFWDRNYYCLAAAISFVFDYFVIKKDGEFMDIPAQDLYNYGLCFFSFFCLKALSD